jgi:hypothetical protein
VVRVEVGKWPAADPSAKPAHPQAEAADRQAAEAQVPDQLAAEAQPPAQEAAEARPPAQEAAETQPPGQLTAGARAAEQQGAGQQAAERQAAERQAPEAKKIATDATEPPRGRTASVTITHMPDNCLQSMVVDAAWPDGTLVRVQVPTCLDGPLRPQTPPALTVDEAVRVAADPRWGVTMDAALVSVGAREFPDPPVFG